MLPGPASCVACVPPCWPLRPVPSDVERGGGGGNLARALRGARYVSRGPGGPAGGKAGGRGARTDRPRGPGGALSRLPLPASLGALGGGNGGRWDPEQKEEGAESGRAVRPPERRRRPGSRSNTGSRAPPLGSGRLRRRRPRSELRRPAALATFPAVLAHASPPAKPPDPILEMGRPRPRAGDPSGVLRGSTVGRWRSGDLSQCCSTRQTGRWARVKPAWAAPFWVPCRFWKVTCRMQESGPRAVGAARKMNGRKARRGKKTGAHAGELLLRIAIFFRHPHQGQWA